MEPQGGKQDVSWSEEIYSIETRLSLCAADRASIRRVSFGLAGVWSTDPFTNSKLT